MSQQLCAQCGSPIKEGHRFCSNCGASVGVPSSPIPISAVGAADDVADDVADNIALEEKVVAPPTLYGPQTPPSPPPARNAGPPRASTMRPDPKEGGMYVPYGVETVTHIEGERNTASRVKPVIFIAAGLLLALLALLALSAFLLLNQRQSTVMAGCTLPSNPTEEDRVKQVVCVSNEEQIKAWRDLDIEVLRGSRTGPVLEENIEYVEDLKERGLYAVPVLGSLDIREVKITGDTATVRTIESWSVTFYNRQDNTIADTRPAETLAETYHMVKQNGKWYVERLDFGENP